jgi:hypothetical protein
MGDEGAAAVGVWAAATAGVKGSNAANTAASGNNDLAVRALIEASLC